MITNLIIYSLILVTGLALNVGLQPIQSAPSPSSMIEGTVGLLVYYPAQPLANGSDMQVIDVKPMYHNGTDPVEVQYRNETISLDIPSYEECIRTLRLHQQEALSLGVTMHFNTTNRAYDDCVERQATQETGPIEIEMLFANDPNDVVQKLSMSGICAFDINLEALEEVLGSEYSDAVKDSLQNSVELSLIDTAAAMGGVPKPETEQECTVKQTWLRGLDEQQQ